MSDHKVSIYLWITSYILTGGLYAVKQTALRASDTITERNLYGKNVLKFSTFLSCTEGTQTLKISVNRFHETENMASKGILGSGNVIVNDTIIIRNVLIKEKPDKSGVSVSLPGYMYQEQWHDYVNLAQETRALIKEVMKEAGELLKKEPGHDFIKNPVTVSTGTVESMIYEPAIFIKDSGTLKARASLIIKDADNTDRIFLSIRQIGIRSYETDNGNTYSQAFMPSVQNKDSGKYYDIIAFTDAEKYESIRDQIMDKYHETREQEKVKEGPEV